MSFSKSKLTLSMVITLATLSQSATATASLQHQNASLANVVRSAGASSSEILDTKVLELVTKFYDRDNGAIHQTLSDLLYLDGFFSLYSKNIKFVEQAQEIRIVDSEEVSQYFKKSLIESREYQSDEILMNFSGLIKALAKSEVEKQYSIMMSKPGFDPSHLTIESFTLTALPDLSASAPRIAWQTELSLSASSSESDTLYRILDHKKALVPQLRNPDAIFEALINNVISQTYSLFYKEHMAQLQKLKLEKQLSQQTIATLTKSKFIEVVGTLLRQRWTSKKYLFLNTYDYGLRFATRLLKNTSTSKAWKLNMLSTHKHLVLKYGQQFWEAAFNRAAADFIKKQSQ